MRITTQHIERAPQFTNTLCLRQLDLRDLSLSMLDETVLGLILNQFDVINLTANALTVLQDFQSLTKTIDRKIVFNRVKVLILHRNRLQRVSSVTCVAALPQIRSFLADHNNFKTIKSLMFIRGWKKLQVLSLQHNPVWTKNDLNYNQEKIRAFLVYICPSLNMINWKRVKQTERVLSNQLVLQFKNKIKELQHVRPSNITQNDLSEKIQKIRKRGKRRRSEIEKSFEVGNNLNDDDNSVKKKEEDNIRKDSSLLNISIQQQLQEIQERLQADDITQEEVEQLEKRMNALLEEQQRL